MAPATQIRPVFHANSKVPWLLDVDGGIFVQPFVNVAFAALG